MPIYKMIPWSYTKRWFLYGLSFQKCNILAKGNRYYPHTLPGWSVRGLVQLERITFRAVYLLYNCSFFVALNLILSLWIIANWVFYAILSKYVKRAIHSFMVALFSVFLPGFVYVPLILVLSPGRWWFLQTGMPNCQTAPFPSPAGGRIVNIFG